MLNKNILNDCFTYSSGRLYWKTRPRSHFKTLCACESFNGQFPGEIAGTITPKGYARVVLFGKGVFVHRVVWVIHNGVIEFGIDHVDGNKLNNNIENLRDVTQSNNAKNAKIKNTNTSGVAGVSWHKNVSRWIARISINKKRINIGSYLCFFEACCARKSAELRCGYHENHGRRT